MQIILNLASDLQDSTIFCILLHKLSHAINASRARSGFQCGKQTVGIDTVSDGLRAAEHCVCGSSYTVTCCRT
jgi:hypothetical protein